MNKQKTLIFSLSAMLFLAVSFIVYSWTEPTTMPSSYNPPINTSSTAQTKAGEIGASVFRDADNSNYYINPSGNSVVSGTISATNPTDNKHVATKGYVDGLFGNVEQEVSLSNLVYVYGINPPCPDEDHIMIQKSWIPKLCQGSDPNCGNCITSDAWLRVEDPKPTCSYYSGGWSCGSLLTCQAENYGEAICVKMGKPLYESIHTVSQCELWNGEVVTVEGDKKICRFNTTTCPGSWKQYKNWSTTQADTISYYDHCPCTTGFHEWGDVVREKCTTGWNGGCRVGDPMVCGSPYFDCGNAYYDGSVSYVHNGGVSCTRMTSCGRAIVKQIGCY